MIFFFSSRRRHTRCSRDWSSDVCSSDLFQGKDRAKALGIYGSIGGGGGAAGVLFGGLLTSGPGWRWVFFVNVPLGIAIVAATPRLVSRARPAPPPRDPGLPRAGLVPRAPVAP